MTIAIYLAAALFNARETYFNSILVEKLGKLGYRTNLPQKDGFEFGNLKDALNGRLPEKEISAAVLDVIYLLDIGVFVKGSDVIIANLDEPMDVGVVVESSYAKLMGKLVIGIRTDVRSPYGTARDIFGGMHHFPAYQCHHFISYYMPSRTTEEREVQMDAMVMKIDETIRESRIPPQKPIPSCVRDNPNFKTVFEGADLLFKGVSDIHSHDGLELIVSRYIKNKEKLKDIRLLFND